jgi:hypothetical protein
LQIFIIPLIKITHLFSLPITPPFSYPLSISTLHLFSVFFARIYTFLFLCPSQPHPLLHLEGHSDGMLVLVHLCSYKYIRRNIVGSPALQFLTSLPTILACIIFVFFTIYYERRSSFILICNHLS